MWGLMFDGLDWSKSESVIGSLGKIYDNTKQGLSVIDDTLNTVVEECQRADKALKEFKLERQKRAEEEYEKYMEIRKRIENKYKKSGSLSLAEKTQMEIEIIDETNKEKEKFIKDNETLIGNAKRELRTSYEMFLSSLGTRSFCNLMGSEIPYEIKSVSFRAMNDGEKAKNQDNYPYFEEFDDIAQKSKYYVGDNIKAQDELGKIANGSVESGISKVANLNKNVATMVNKKGYNYAFVERAVLSVLGVRDKLTEQQKSDLRAIEDGAKKSRREYEAREDSFDLRNAEAEARLIGIYDIIRATENDNKELNEQIKNGKQQINEYELLLKGLGK